MQNNQRPPINNLIISMPNQITLTHTSISNAKVVYKIIPDSLKETLTLSSDSNYDPITYTENDWTGNTKHCSYEIPFQQTDNSQAAAVGTYYGNFAIDFSQNAYVH